MSSEASRIIKKILSYSVRRPSGCLVCHLGLSHRGRPTIGINRKHI